MRNVLTPPYTPIQDYGMIGNCRTAALISKAGSLDWCCFPHFDSRSFFASMLDRERGGTFSITPVQAYRSKQHYLEDTNVLVTTFITESGEARLLDCFTVTSEAAKKGKLWPNHEILRRVEGVAGEVEFELVYHPRPRYGQRRVHFSKRGKLGLMAFNGGNLLVLQTDLPEPALQVEDRGEFSLARARFKTRTGSLNRISLIYDSESPTVIAPLGASADERFEETIRYWKSWVSTCTYRGPYACQVRRSALALKLLTFAPSGAIIAAPTTSLPERLGGVRNWDYRYCWLRDAALTTRALSSLGFFEEAKSFASWMLSSTRLSWPRLQVTYTIYGEVNIPERELGWLEGYERSAPVRVGNAAAGQSQLDVYGEVLSAVWQMADHLAPFGKESQKFIMGLGRAVSELWQEPDDGIWEVRSGRVQHTHSKVMAWVALDRLIKLNERFGWQQPVEEFRKIAERLRESIEARGYNAEIGAYVRAFDGRELDASLLTLPLFDYCEASDPRMIKTREAIFKNLSARGLLYRYNQFDDGLPAKEGSFGICNFWMIENLVRSGDLARARQSLDALLALGNDLGLWSEEIDPATEDYLGNYPQGFTHIGLINAVVALAQMERGERVVAA